MSQVSACMPGEGASAEFADHLRKVAGINSRDRAYNEAFLDGVYKSEDYLDAHSFPEATRAAVDAGWNAGKDYGFTDGRIFEHDWICGNLDQPQIKKASRLA
jgi:hypothetical protein